MLRIFWSWWKGVKRKRLITGLFAVALGMAGYLVAAQAPARNSRGASPPAPGAVLAARSPGVRMRGALYQTKPRRAAQVRAYRRPHIVVPRVVPRERVLSVVRTRPAAPLSVLPEGGPLALLDLSDLPQGVGPIALPSVSRSLSPAFDLPFENFGGGFEDGPVVPPIGPLEPGEGPGAGPAPAVPEPTTWAMMAFGLGMIGFALRRSEGRRQGAPCAKSRERFAPAPDRSG